MQMLLNKSELGYLLDLLDSLIIDYELYTDAKNKVKCDFVLFGVYYYVTLKAE